MTPAEIIAAAREIVNASTPCATHSYSHQHAVAERHALKVARELLRLHDGAGWTATPPTEPGDWWFRETMESKPYFCKVYHHKVHGLRCDLAQGYTTSLPSGFWLSAEPATASAMASLRDALKMTAEECGGVIIDRDRLAAELVAVRQSIDAAHDWLTEAVGDYCKPAVEEPIETLAEQLRLRCESAAKRLTEAKAALATQQRCPWERSLDEICPVHGGPCGQCPIPQRLESKP